MEKVQAEAAQLRQRYVASRALTEAERVPLLHEQSGLAAGFAVQDEANRIFQDLMGALAAPAGQLARLLPARARNLRLVNQFETHVAVTGRLVGSVNTLLQSLSQLEAALLAWDCREAAWREAVLDLLAGQYWRRSESSPAEANSAPASGPEMEARRWAEQAVEGVMGHLRELAQSVAIVQGQVPHLRAVLDDATAGVMQHLSALSVRTAQLESEAAVQRQENEELRQRLARLEEKLDGIAFSTAPSPQLSSNPVSPEPISPRQSVPAEPPATAVPIGGPEFDFLAWEELTRGEEGAISAEQKKYLPIFTDAPGPVLDAGCGRGEFLSLLAAAGIDSYGIDLDSSMVAHCRTKGLRVEVAELFEHLQAIADNSLGGLFLAQVVEHIPPPALRTLTDLAYARLRPGGVILMETINPTCLTTFSGAFYADPTHHKPVHPKALEYFLTASGFGPTEIVFSAPIPDDQKLQSVREESPLDPAVKSVVLQINGNFERLNSVLYGFANFAAIARKPAAQ